MSLAEKIIRRHERNCARVDAISAAIEDVPASVAACVLADMHAQLQDATDTRDTFADYWSLDV